MVGLTHKQQLSNYIQYMHDEGILDHHFDNIRELQRHQNHRFVSQMIMMFINEADDVMETVTRYMMNNSEVDFDDLSNNVHQLKGSTRSIGGFRMAHVCRELCHASDEENMERCLEIFQRLEREYQTLR